MTAGADSGCEGCGSRRKPSEAGRTRAADKTACGRRDRTTSESAQEITSESCEGHSRNVRPQRGLVGLPTRFVGAGHIPRNTCAFWT